MLDNTEIAQDVPLMFLYIAQLLVNRPKIKNKHFPPYYVAIVLKIISVFLL